MTWRNGSIGRFYDAGEGDIVYFDAHSGDTHLLGDFAAYIVRTIDQQSITKQELLRRITPDIESGDSAELEAAVSNVLAELVALDILIED